MDLRTYLDTNELSQQQFADKVSVSQGLVWQWLNWLEGKTPATRITAEKAVAIEQATGGQVTRSDLRPDLFGAPAPTAPAGSDGTAPPEVIRLRADEVPQTDAVPVAGLRGLRVQSGAPVSPAAPASGSTAAK